LLPGGADEEPSLPPHPASCDAVSSASVTAAIRLEVLVFTFVYLLKNSCPALAARRTVRNDVDSGITHFGYGRRIDAESVKGYAKIAGTVDAVLANDAGSGARPVLMRSVSACRAFKVCS
jgi:hypothetical protein